MIKFDKKFYDFINTLIYIFTMTQKRNIIGFPNSWVFRQLQTTIAMDGSEHEVQEYADIYIEYDEDERAIELYLYGQDRPYVTIRLENMVAFIVFLQKITHKINSLEEIPVDAFMRFMKNAINDSLGDLGKVVGDDTKDRRGTD